MNNLQDIIWVYVVLPFFLLLIIFYLCYNKSSPIKFERDSNRTPFKLKERLIIRTHSDGDLVSHSII